MRLRFEGVAGMRITAFVTNSIRGQVTDLELRRRRVHCEEHDHRAAPEPHIAAR
ncbi:hypothetical protein Cch01nite_18900 [Cellulomonas chitinilytica]|uniref:Uncharacterized protein n=1 Tax=Cellulomonas chitinilytica TaxID=398759 RepID=A0A919P3Y6_9CELL|nr:hypothetical protein [Cellulomonas chitinilytica]GIG21166.1 hypothetical protein Cch01nite_18900 [Cellulomonas chitinilytica]